MHPDYESSDSSISSLSSAYRGCGDSSISSISSINSSRSSVGSGYIASGENTRSLDELAEACQFAASSQKMQPESTRLVSTPSKCISIPVARLEMLEAYERLVSTHSCFRGAVFDDLDAQRCKNGARNNAGLSNDATVGPANEEVIGFVYALYRIIENTSNSQWIRWTDNGSSFEFCNWERLMACLRGYGLKARQKASVTKNLTDYSFRRLKDMRRRVPGLEGVVWWQFSHPHFVRGSPERLCRIVRSYGKKEKTKRNDGVAGSSANAAYASANASANASAIGGASGNRDIDLKRRHTNDENAGNNSATDASIRRGASKRSRKGKERED